MLLCLLKCLKPNESKNDFGLGFYMLLFFGDVISKDKPGITTQLLEEQFKQSPIEVRELDTAWGLFYTGRCTQVPDRYSLTVDNRNQIKLEPYQMQQLINNLKRVRSDLIYNSYSDKMGVHCLPEKEQPRLVVKRRIVLKK